MRDYLEELLEEPVEEDVLSLPQSARRADSSLVRGSRGDAGTGGEIPQSALLPAPLVRGPRVTEDGEAGRVREAVSYEEKKGQNPPVSFADSPLSKGAKGRGAEALRSRLRRGAVAAAYQAATPHPASADATFPSRGRQGLEVAELDAAVRRDARRYDGEMTLY